MRRGATQRMRGFGSLRRRHDVHHTSHTRWHYLAQLNPSIVMPKTLNICSGDDGKRLVGEHDQAHSLRQEVRKSAAVTVRAMPVLQIVMRMRVVGGPVCHRHSARRAQLSPLCHHAFRGLRHVRSELRTKPHRIRRASLARFRAALSGSVCDPHCAHSNQ